MSVEQAEHTLASFADSLVPHPFDDAESFPDQDLARRIFNELTQVAKVEGVEDPVEVRRRVFATLAQELSSYALQSADIPAIQDRLGMRGALRPAAYRVEIGAPIAKLSDRGIRRSHIEAAVRSPDIVQHLESPDDLGRDHLPAISLFAKKIKSSRTSESFVLLVQAKRVGASQAIQTAWRIYADDIVTPTELTPLGLLQAFVEAFGLEFTIGDTPPTKFTLYRRVAIAPGTPQSNIIRFVNPGNDKVEGHHYVRFIPEEGIVEVSLSYVINVSKYQSALMRHATRGLF